MIKVISFFLNGLPGNLFVQKMLRTLAKKFITGTSQTQTHEGCRWTPFTLQIHADHTFFEDTKVLFRSILQRCASFSRENQDGLSVSLGFLPRFSWIYYQSNPMQNEH